MVIKEGTFYDEHWVLHVSDEMLNSAPKTRRKTEANSGKLALT